MTDKKKTILEAVEKLTDNYRKEDLFLGKDRDRLPNKKEIMNLMIAMADYEVLTEKEKNTKKNVFDFVHGNALKRTADFRIIKQNPEKRQEFSGHPGNGKIPENTDKCKDG